MYILHVTLYAKCKAENRRTCQNCECRFHFNMTRISLYVVKQRIDIAFSFRNISVFVCDYRLLAKYACRFYSALNLCKHICFYKKQLTRVGRSLSASKKLFFQSEILSVKIYRVDRDLETILIRKISEWYRFSKQLLK